MSYSKCQKHWTLEDMLISNNLNDFAVH